VDDRSSKSYVWYWGAAVLCAALSAGLGVASAEADTIGLSRQWLGIFAVMLAIVGVIAAALPSIKNPPQKASPPVMEPKPPGPDLIEE
jgi:hypothetical protein